MKLLKRVARTIVRIDRATGKIRDGAIRMVKAHIRKGRKVRAHKPRRAKRKQARA